MPRFIWFLFLSQRQYLMWADRKCKLLEQFFGGQKRCFGRETVDLQNEDFCSFTENMIHPEVSRHFRAVFICVLREHVTRTAREGAKHLKGHLQETRLARRCQYVRFCSCTFVGTFVLTQCGITPAIQLRSLLGYLRITRIFSGHIIVNCNWPWTS